MATPSGAEEFMREALALAARGRDSVSPNPVVGALVVRRGRIVGRGWHRRLGGAHAEVEALRCAGGQARGADLYVTLEPCGHHGRTPPCSTAIIESGVRRVFFAAADPNPAARGRGPRALRRRGIAVKGDLLAAEARAQNAPYFHWRGTGRPWVILKWAMSADGKIATRTGASRWISGESSRRLAHRLRRRVDAVMVGARTLQRDDPSLLPRPARGRVPLRVILDRRARLPLGLRVLADDGTPRLYVSSVAPTARRRRALEARGIELLRVADRRDGIDLEHLLEELGRREISQILVEGGGRLAGGLVDARLVEEVVVFVAPCVLGGAGAPVPVAGRGVSSLVEALGLADVAYRRRGRDIVLTGHVAPRSP